MRNLNFPMEYLTEGAYYHVSDRIAQKGTNVIVQAMVIEESNVFVKFRVVKVNKYEDVEVGQTVRWRRDYYHYCEIEDIEINYPEYLL